MIRELWNRHMDTRRALSVGLGVAAYVLCVVALAVAPGMVTSGGANPPWIAGTAPALGGAVGMAIRGWAFHRRPGTRNGLRWALAQGGLMFLATLALFVLAALINPIVGPSLTLAWDAWLGMLATAMILGTAAGVLWERTRRGRRTGAAMLLAFVLIVVGLVGLRAGGPWLLFGSPPLVIGVIALFLAAIQNWSDLVDTAADRPT